MTRVPNAMPVSELLAHMRSPAAREGFSPLSGTPWLLVEPDAVWPQEAQLPHCPVLAFQEERDAPSVVDVCLADDSQAARVISAIDANPLAASALVRLLRHNERASVADGLFAESLAYSTLQHGREYRAWLAGHRSKPAREHDEPAVLLDRLGDELRITLNRPRRHNAYSTELRDALCEALTLVAEDASIERAVLRGLGPSFSAGGDLDEFGAADDAAVADASRATRSAAVLLHQLRARVEAHLHGACIGAGVELPAFVERTVARPGAFFQLPEVGMGLIPGAGGTVSILRRIGRRRLAYMALAGERIDALTAWRWGLVDEIIE